MNQQPMSAPKPAVSKWLWIVLIIVILGAGGFFGWYFLMGPGKKVATTSTPTTTTSTTSPSTSTTTNSNTTDWKTYTSSTLGFSFKYPTTYATKESTGNLTGDVAGNEVLVGQTANLTDQKSAHILIYPTASTYTLSEPDGMDPVSTSDTTVGGVKAKKYVGDPSVYVVVSNNRRYEIVVPTALSKADLDNFTEILSTFQFTQ